MTNKSEKTILDEKMQGSPSKWPCYACGTRADYWNQKSKKLNPKGEKISDKVFLIS